MNKYLETQVRDNLKLKIPHYISADEKRKAFGEKAYRQINTAREFDEWYAAESKSDECVFRGIKEASYKNFTSAQRHQMLFDLPGKDTTAIVAKELEQLRKTHGHLLEAYCTSQALPCSDLFLLSLAQHHGGISPLLDFTHNLNTALFFMTDGASMPDAGADKGELGNYVSLYLFPKKNILTLDQMMDSTAKVMESCSKELSYVQIYNELTNACLKLFSHALFSHTWRGRFVLIENRPYFKLISEQMFGIPLVITNLNIVAQQGCFVYSDKDLLPIEKGLGCLDIHKSLVPYIVSKYLAGYTHETMYPQEENIMQRALFNAMTEIHK